MALYKDETIGLVGIGLMGSAIAERLLETGWPVQLVAHKNRSRINPLLEKGATLSADISALCSTASVILACVPSGDPVRQVISSAIECGRPGQTIIDCSTSHPDVAVTLHSQAVAKELGLVDAAILRTPVQARAGKLVFLAGGDIEHLDHVRPVLDDLSEAIVHGGPAGSGHRLKLFSNAYVHTNLALLCELAAHAEIHGIYAATLKQVYSLGAGNSRLVEMVLSAISSGEHDESAHIRNTIKALGSYVDVARSSRAHSEIVEGAYAQYRNGIGAGLSQDALTRLYDVLVEQNRHLKDI